MVTAREQGLLSATDHQHLQRASELGRAIVTADVDFLVIAREPLARGDSFPGLLFIQQHTPVGEAIRAIADAAEILDPADITNGVEWIP